MVNTIIIVNQSVIWSISSIKSFNINVITKYYRYKKYLAWLNKANYINKIFVH